MRLEVQDVSCGYAGKAIVSGISLEMGSGDSLCLLGPNGVGKTTFFKTLLGLLKLKSGKILLNGEDINKWSRKTFAKKVGYVPQVHTPPFPFKVIDVVVMGRTAHVGVFSSPGAKDREIAKETLEMLSISHLQERTYTELSGGERQLVMIARALAQQPEILIMDEPTSNLDFGNQIKVLCQIKRLTKESNIGVIMTTHFPDHAFLCASRVAVMGRNNTFITGTPVDVISEEVLKQTYGVDVKVIEIGEQMGEKLKICVPVLKH
ncbi:MAG: Iron-chelate-transporting ATPase [Firmicutes bacterium]|nr:Iron-chelate-transporting ATPase [Bacillota bacterium]